MLKTRQMAYPVPTKGLSWPSLDMALLFAPSHLLRFHPSHKDIAGYDIMKLKVS